jgi:hypothetical protein
MGVHGSLADDQLRGDLAAQVRDLLIQEVDVAELGPEHHPLVSAHDAQQRLL